MSGETFVNPYYFNEPMWNKTISWGLDSSSTAKTYTLNRRHVRISGGRIRTYDLRVMSPAYILLF